MRVAVRAVVVLLVPVMFGLGTVAAFAGSATRERVERTDSCRRS